MRPCRARQAKLRPGFYESLREEAAGEVWLSPERLQILIFDGTDFIPNRRTPYLANGPALLAQDRKRIGPQKADRRSLWVPDKQGAFISIEVFGKLLRVQRGFSQQFEIHEATHLYKTAALALGAADALEAKVSGRFRPLMACTRELRRYRRGRQVDSPTVVVKGNTVETSSHLDGIRIRKATSKAALGKLVDAELDKLAGETLLCGVTWR